VKARLLLALVICALVMPTPARADGTPANDVALEIKALAARISEVRANPSLDQDARLADLIAFASRNQRLFLMYAVLRRQYVVVVSAEDIAAARPPSLAGIEQARTDMQTGASPSASGTSSVVTKGSAPSYFSAAVEQGALLASGDGVTTTFRGNVMGVLDLLGSGGYVTSYQDDGGAAKVARRVSFSFTLNNTSTLDDDASGIAQRLGDLRDRLEQFSVHVVVGRNRRDPRNADNRTALRTLMDTRGQDVLRTFEDALGELQVSDAYDEWVTESVRELKTVPLPFLEGALVRRLNVLSDVLANTDPDFEAHALQALTAYSAFLRARDRTLETIESQPIYAVEFVRRRNAGAPDLSTYRFIAEAQKGRWDLTFNAAYTGYDTSSEGGGSLLHDVQFSAGADRPLGDRNLRGQSSSVLGNAVLTFAFLYERLEHPGAISLGNATLTAPSGNLFLGQVQLTLPMSGGVKLPLSLSMSNRTELLDEKQIRAHVGFTFNFNAVAAALLR
jgi:hypothetical protein